MFFGREEEVEAICRGPLVIAEEISEWISTDEAFARFMIAACPDALGRASNTNRRQHMHVSDLLEYMAPLACPLLSKCLLTLWRSLF